MERKVRVRFAPSPTGPLHIGGVRTALYNYLFAKQHGGDLLLRIEDTDQTRFVPGAEQYIIEAFEWLNIKFDEGVGIGGDCGPYRQSERKPMYKQYADYLVENGHAYYAFDTAEELDKYRKQCEAEKKTFQYDASTRMGLKNSLAMPEEEVKKLLNDGTPYVIRIKIPEGETVELDDMIRGHVKVQTSVLDDKVLFKSDGMPTYHLANIVDDHLMRITHVIRGEEWLPSAPMHVLLYRYLGWADTMPQFAHLPLLLKPDGNGKLSKRDGDRLGFPVFPLQWTDPKTGDISSGYRETGYFPEAVVNILALLGWNPGNDEELLSMDDLIRLFSVEHISKSGAKFDLEKAKWFNHQYLQRHSNEEIAKLFLPELKQRGINADFAYVENVVSKVKERANFVSDLWKNSYYLFEAPTSYSEQAVKKRWKDGTAAHLTNIADMLEALTPFDRQQAHDQTMDYITSHELGVGQIMNCIRLSIVGDTVGIDLFEMIDMLGKDESIKRIRKAIETINR